MKHRTPFMIAAAVLLAALVTAPASASAIPRDLAITRGLVWARWVQSRDASGRPTAWGVPYSQTKYAKEDGTPVGTHSDQGWRTDCSGFVSMCYNLRTSSGLPYSSYTREMATLKSKFYQISPKALQPGDFMLASDVWGSPSPHAVLFYGWANDAHTQYWALEQTTTSTHNGTILRVRDFPGKYYRPFRYVGIEDAFSDTLDSVSGLDRFQVAASGSQAAFPTSTTPSVPALVVASGMNWPDALGASGLAGAVGGPLLLTMPRSLPASTASEITRLKPKTVYVLGGTGSVTASVTARIASLGPKVVRVGGRDRYDTAALAASQTAAVLKVSKRTVDTVYLATGANFSDALAVSPISTRLARPVLLTSPLALSTYAQREIKALGVKKVVIVGGTGSVGTGVVSALKKMSVTTTRVAGLDRYATAGAIADYGISLGLTWQSCGVASGVTFPDALSGGVAQGHLGQVMLLTRPTTVPSPAIGRIRSHRAAIGRARIFGGSVSYAARKQIATVLRAK